MTPKERLARWRRRRREADTRIARLDQKIRTRLVRLAARPALAAYLARRFNLRFTSGWRSVQHNKAVGGVPNSWHTRGNVTNPGAVDLVGAMADMQEALAWAREHVPNLAEAMIHDVGSGKHLHLGGTGVMAWEMPKRGLLKKWRTRRADARKQRDTADAKIAELKGEVVAQPAKGIDVSSHQGAVDFAKVKAAGYDFCWAKATEGQDWADPTFWRNVTNARLAGVKVGAYHFLRPRAGRTGDVEARWLHQHLQRVGLGVGDLLPVLDVETTALGRDATIRYTRQAIMDWSSDVCWQHSSSGRVPGVQGDVDLNRTPDLRRLVA